MPLPHRFLRTVAVVLTIGLPVSIASGTDVATTRDCSFMVEAGEPIHGILKRRTGPELPVVIPKNYLGGPFIYPKNGQPGRDGTLLLYMHRENPLPCPIPQMKGKLERGIQDWINLLVVDFISVENSANAALSVYTRATRKGEMLDTPQYDYGLHKYDISEDLNDGEIDVFLAGNPDRKTDVIKCSRIVSYGRLNPQCEQTTVLHGVKTTYVYNRRYLHDWQNMRANVERLIYCILNPKVT